MTGWWQFNIWFLSWPIHIESQLIKCNTCWFGCSTFIRYCSARSAASTDNSFSSPNCWRYNSGFALIADSLNRSCLSNLNHSKCELCKSLYISALRSYTAIGVTVEIVSCHQRQTLSRVLGDQVLKSLVSNGSAMRIHLYHLK